MNREKRKASGQFWVNSIPEYSTISRNDAMEIEEELTVDHERSSAGVGNDSERHHFRYEAWLLREKLNALVDGDQGEPPELELRNLLNMAASRKIISVDPKVLNPFLWRTLPKELLFLVFARLPVPDITRLRSLSKEWNRDMATANSDINRACDESSPIMVAGFSRLEDLVAEFLVTVCTPRWQFSYHLRPGDSIPGEDRWDDMGARDGGLVCFVSTSKPSKANPLCIVVVNLLTRVQRKLPPLHYVYTTPPKMVHIKVDSETKFYRVVVIGENKKGRPRVEIYDSGAGRWTKATPPLGLIFGLAYDWDWNTRNATFRSTGRVESVYDFAEEQLRPCDKKGLVEGVSVFEGVSVLKYKVQKDCMFVLHRSARKGEFLPVGGYCITKYRLHNNAKEWVQERSYLCPPFEALLEMNCRYITLEACEGFLMAFETFGDSDSPCEQFWLLDLSTGEWSSLPNCFDEENLWCGTSMIQPSWNVVP